MPLTDDEAITLATLHGGEDCITPEWIGEWVFDKDHKEVLVMRYSLEAGAQRYCKEHKLDQPHD